MTKSVTPILEQARTEGYKEGWSQAGQCAYDEAYYQGQQSSWAIAPSRSRWFMFGLVCGAACSMMVWVL